MYKPIVFTDVMPLPPTLPSAAVERTPYALAYSTPSSALDLLYTNSSASSYAHIPQYNDNALHDNYDNEDDSAVDEEQERQKAIVISEYVPCTTQLVVILITICHCTSSLIIRTSLET